MDGYEKRLKSLYCEPKDEEILGLFLCAIPGSNLISPPVPPPKSKRRRMCQPKT